MRWTCRIGKKEDSKSKMYSNEGKIIFCIINMQVNIVDYCNIKNNNNNHGKVFLGLGSVVCTIMRQEFI